MSCKHVYVKIKLIWVVFEADLSRIEVSSDEEFAGSLELQFLEADERSSLTDAVEDILELL